MGRNARVEPIRREAEVARNRSRGSAESLRQRIRPFQLGATPATAEPAKSEDVYIPCGMLDNAQQIESGSAEHDDGHTLTFSREQFTRSLQSRWNVRYDLSRSVYYRPYLGL